MSDSIEAATLREGFERWIKSKFICLDGGLNEWTRQFEYVYPHVQSMWTAWQGAAAYHHAELAALRAQNESLKEQLRGADSVTALLSVAIEKLREHTADCQSVVREMGHAGDCPAKYCVFPAFKNSAAQCSAIAEYHDGYVVKGKHEFQPGPCSCGHDRVVGGAV